MPNPARRTIALAALAVAIIAAAVALDLPSAAAQSEEQTGRIVARRLDDGRTEFGWQPANGERVLPRARYFPADAQVDRWLNSSLVEVGGAEIGRINARLRSDGRIEFAFTPTDGERIAPPARYFPAGARVGRWLRSTTITIDSTPPPPVISNGFSAVSAGISHTCAIRANGAIECWGWNQHGQADAPAGRFSAVSAGYDHTCAIGEDGAIQCWGSNSSGKSTSPTGRFTAVSISVDHSCAIRDTGAIECWGDDIVALIDHEGTAEEFNIGRTDAPAGRFTAVSAAYNHTCAIGESGAIQCWGGFGAPPYPPPPTGSFSAVAAADETICAIGESGAIECLGWNADGQADAPAGRFTAVSGVGFHTCAIGESGAIQCWGLNDNDQADTPEGSFTSVSAGGAHTCAIRAESGAIECWGNNDYGQTDAPAP